DFFWRVQERLDDGWLSYFSNHHGACALGRGNLDGLYASSLSQGIHGHDKRAVETTCRSSSDIACAGDAAGRRASLLRIFSAILRASGGACVSYRSHRRYEPSHGYADL